MFKWLRSLFSSDFSYRSENGVKINVTENWRGWTHSVDFDDPQTKEFFRRRLEEFAQYDVVDGKLVKKEDK